MDEPAMGLRERTRNAVRAQLADAALKLFVEQGFEATTVEQIAAATGLSRRSFHRYFAGKEDVLGQWSGEMAERLATALASRPLQESPWLALRRAFDIVIDEFGSRPDAVDITRMTLGTPALHPGHVQKQAAWRNALAGALQERLAERGSRPAQIAATALAGAALASLESAQIAWVSEDNDQPLETLVDEAMSAVAPLTRRR